MHKNAIKLEILWVGGKYYPKKGPKLANFPRFWAKNLANLAMNWTKIGDFSQKSSGNTVVNRQFFLLDIKSQKFFKYFFSDRGIATSHQY